MPYPSLYGSTYIETANDTSKGAVFITNDLLLCFMMFLRIHFVVRALTQMSFYTNPRAQRVCNIYGAEATDQFAMKCIMKKFPWHIIGGGWVICLFLFSYCIRLFEKQF